MTKTRMKIKPDVALDTNGASFKIVLWKTTAVVFKVARNSLGTQLWKGSSVLFWKSWRIHVKVQLFWEGHKNLHIVPQGFDIYLVNVKTMRKIAQIFVAFSEKLKRKETMVKKCQ